MEAINSGLARNTDEALDQALDALRGRMPLRTTAETPGEAVAAAARRLEPAGASMHR